MNVQTSDLWARYDYRYSTKVLSVGGIEFVKWLFPGFHQRKAHRVRAKLLWDYLSGLGCVAWSFHPPL